MQCEYVCVDIASVDVVLWWALRLHDTNECKVNVDQILSRNFYANIGNKSLFIGKIWIFDPPMQGDARMCDPFSVQNLSFSCSFRQNFYRLIDWRISFGWRLLLGNPGSATAWIRIFWKLKIHANQKAVLLCFIFSEHFPVVQCPNHKTTWYLQRLWVPL